MRKKEKTRVIWKHPRGRFEIQETEHYSLFDHCTYYTRECVFTPRDDARGLCSEVPTGIFVPEEIKQEGRWQPRVTDEEKQQLVKMYQAGMPIRAISRETGRACDTISNVLEELGCRKKKLHKSVHWTYEEFQKVVAMRKRGYLYKEIGAALGKSNHAVQNKFAREGY